ncbi:hypothetical protein PPYR_11807 [Photinus pyralis]|uniref:Single domain-containing protein n=1 Tax=Photinus pyralis TaxID=7054 RepID=A0A5N4ACJ1_PHOPY|nr:U-scoloptoxin(16)-Er13a-like [Photinus pyralis]KAB0794968.1 hypothetical protein PPYR_11807 [Photinus pyralis]
MKILTTFVCIFAFLSVALGWTSLEQVPVNSEYCESSDPSTGKVKIGESRPATGCVRITCSPGLIQFAGCGVASVSKPCYMGEEDLSKPYPDCCPQPVCP